MFSNETIIISTSHSPKTKDELLAAEIKKLKEDAAAAEQAFTAAKGRGKKNDEDKYKSAITIIKCYRQLNLPRYGLSYMERYKNSAIIEDYAHFRHYSADHKGDGPLRYYYFQIRYHRHADKYQHLIPELLKPLARWYWWQDLRISLIGIEVEDLLQMVFPVFLEDPLLDSGDREYLLGKISENAARLVMDFLSKDKKFFNGFIKLIELIDKILPTYSEHQSLIINFLANVLPAFRQAYLRNHSESNSSDDNRGIPDTPAIREGFFQWYLKGVDFLAEHANTPDLKALIKQEYEAIPSGTNAAGSAQLRLANIVAESPEALSTYKSYYAKAREEFEVASNLDYLIDKELPDEFKQHYGLYHFTHYHKEWSSLPAFDKLVSLNKSPSIDTDKEIVNSVLMDLDAKETASAANDLAKIKTPAPAACIAKPADEKKISEENVPQQANDSNIFAGFIAFGLAIKNGLTDIAMAFYSAFTSEDVSEQARSSTWFRFFDSPVSETRNPTNNAGKIENTNVKQFKV